MKEIWVKVDPWNKELVTTAIEGGADGVMVPPGKTAQVKKLGRIATLGEDGDLKWERDIVSLEIRSPQDEAEIIKVSRHKRVLVKTADWNIIPLENLVARTGNIWVEVSTMEQARTAAGVLERGVDGLVLSQPDPSKLREILAGIKSAIQNIKLSRLKIVNIRLLAMGDRVCVDTCTMMKPGEGILAGNSSRALFLIHAETLPNPYVEPRPFRVNAGPVHAYVMGAEGRTRYLCELEAGQEVLMVNWQGQARPLVVGRVKIERRPLVLVEAQGPEGMASLILQNAETIRLVKPGGGAVSVVELRPGDQVLAFLDEPGRHFGHKVKETITEK